MDVKPVVMNVSKILFTTPDDGVRAYSVEEYIKIDSAVKVGMTIGENKFEYYDAEGDIVRGVIALMYLAKKRREYLSAIGEGY